MKIYVRGGQANFICESCGSSKLKHLSKHIPHVKYTCSECGFITSCNLCYRSTYRKSCDITAIVFSNTGPSKGIRFPVKILDMSLHGYKLNWLKKSPFNVGDELIIEFELPSKKNNKISQDIKIQNIISDDIELRHYSKKFELCGAKVINLNPYSEQQKIKGFWLMP